MFQRLRLKFVARRELALAPTGDTTACLKASSLVGGVRVFSLAEALEDGVESEFSDELLMFACLAGCTGTNRVCAARAYVSPRLNRAPLFTRRLQTNITMSTINHMTYLHII